MKSIYLAGSSQESRMVAGYAEQLIAAGYTTPCPWWNDVEHARSLGLTDKDLTDEEAQKIGADERSAVIACDLFWLLMPETPSAGCWTELGIRLATFGENRVFTSLVDRSFAAHDEALAWLVGR